MIPVRIEKVSFLIKTHFPSNVVFRYMRLIQKLIQRVDPERLIPFRTWLGIGILGTLSGLLFGATILLFILEERLFSHRIVRDLVLPVSALAGLVFFFLLHFMWRNVRQVLRDRIAFRNLYEEQKIATSLVRNIMDMAPIGYHSIGKDGIIREMNQTELDWLGYHREEVIGKKRIIELIYEPDRPRFEVAFKLLIKSGTVRNFDLNWVAKDGTPIPVLVNTNVIYDETGQFSHTISTIINYADRKKLEDQLVAAREEAEYANQLKQRFMANMSHEIRTPLNAIMGFGNLLGRPDIPQERQKEYIQMIQTSGASLLAITNDILDFEKLQNGMLRIEAVEFNLKILLHSIIKLIGPSAEVKSLALSMELTDGLPDMIVGDPNRLSQVLLNLLNNAVKFTNEGSVVLRVEAAREQKSQGKIYIRFLVEDTGIGIPASEHALIFEGFVQSDSGMARKYGGTGIGLSLVKIISEKLHGTIDLISEPGKGSTFIVVIPYLTVPKQRVQLPDSVETDKVKTELSGHSILLVEDNPTNICIAEIYLTELGLSVSIAVNGLEAIEILRSTPKAFDLVFLDIEMPRMDGFHTARAIRNELGLANLPIVAMTAHVLSAEWEKALASGMNDYLTKPVIYKNLVSLLLRYLSGPANS